MIPVGENVIAAFMPSVLVYVIVTVNTIGSSPLTVDTIEYSKTLYFTLLSLICPNLLSGHSEL